VASPNVCCSPIDTAGARGARVGAERGGLGGVHARAGLVALGLGVTL
jgi:hypothetical protein